MLTDDEALNDILFTSLTDGEDYELLRVMDTPYGKMGVCHKIQHDQGRSYSVKGLEFTIPMLALVPAIPIYNSIN